MSEILIEQIPDRGWHHVRASTPGIVCAYMWAGLIKARVTPTLGVYEVRLTRAGRKYKAERVWELDDEVQ